MPDNLYDLRSPEVQEVMLKPPKTPISWGNTVIFLILIIGLVLSKEIKVDKKTQIPFLLTHREGVNPASKYVIRVDSVYQTKLRRGQFLSISMDHNSSDPTVPTKIEISNTSISGNELLIIPVNMNFKNEQNKKDIPGMITVSFEKVSVFDVIKKSFDL